MVPLLLELQGPNDLNGSVLLSNFGASPQANGSINLSVIAHIQAKVQAHWGEALRPHRRQRLPARRRLRWEYRRPRGERCRPGRVVQSATSGSLGYVVSLVSPNTANMTISVGFQYIGDLGIPMSFNLPMGKLSSGEFPMLLFQEGSFELPDGSKRSYAVTLKPGGVQADQTGITANWTSAVTFK